MNTQERSSTLLAATFAVIGVGVLISLFILQADPEPMWLWATFAASFVALEFSSVEVNDRLYVSGSILAAFTAAVVFGRDSAVLAVALMAAVAVLHPDDLRGRRWRQPALNFGQLVLSATIGITIFWPFLPVGELTLGHLPQIAAGAALAAAVYDWVNFRMVRFIVRRLYPERSMSSWSAMLPNHLALALLGAFGGVLGAAYVLVGPIILPLIFVSFLIAQAVFHSYSQLRSAHEDTIRGFVKAVEALDSFTRGHTERVAHFTEITGRRLGLAPARLGLLRWASLLHDVGKAAVPPELLYKSGALTTDERLRVSRHMKVVEDVLGQVEFLRPAVAVTAMQHRIEESELADADATMEARILAAADAFDAMTSSRSYRSAVTQEEAFAKLRGSQQRYGTEVVEALISAVTDSGEVYGSPDEASSAEVEELVRERARRA